MGLNGMALCTCLLVSMSLRAVHACRHTAALCHTTQTALSGGEDGLEENQPIVGMVGVTECCLWEKEPEHVIQQRWSSSFNSIQFKSIDNVQIVQ